QRPAIQPRAHMLDGGVERACTGRRRVFFDNAFVDTPIFSRQLLQPGDCVRGPAIVEEFGSTTVVDPSLEARVDDFANLILTKLETGGRPDP
ncbi:MAG TPA: hydantoinase/oxoprolinase family protein, partial [Chloroflexota bacterium]|nr:hydantoinase/oxoprolinase family protein [Chloroflexota bacterium]